MERYEVRFQPSVRKDLRGVPKHEVDRILRRIEHLAESPRPRDSRKLTGGELYRIRSGSYRILYQIEDLQLVVTVVKVGHRKAVYR